MAPSAVAVPNILKDPGYLFIAPIGSTEPSNTVAGSVFTDAWPVAWLPLGATAEGSEHSDSIEVEQITVAEFITPIAQVVTGQATTIAFALANFTLSNYRRAMNGGVTALTASSGSGATALYTVEPTTPGSEVKCMIGWESLDNTVRMVGRQCMQGGEVTVSRRKAPDLATIPCTFNLETPTSAKAWTMWGAGATRA